MMSQIRLNTQNLNANGVFDMRNNNPLLTPQHPSHSGVPWRRPPINIEDPKVVQRLVNNLIYLFNIEPGDHITFILGHGECLSNNSALQAWVLDQIADVPINQDGVLNELVEKLKDQLMMEVYS